MANNTTPPDPLLQYALALDAANFDGIGAVLQQAQSDESLYNAIEALHNRFDSNESFTEQLQRARGEWEGRAC